MLDFVRGAGGKCGLWYHGTRVRKVLPGGAAERAGLLEGWELRVIAGVAVGSVDQFSNLIGVIGALGCIPLAVVFPNVCELRIMGDRLPRKTVIFNRVILGVGFVGTAVGTFVAVYLWITSAGEKEPECRFLKNQ